jgi:hypothetical protein
MAMVSARVEAFSFLFAFSKCSCAVDEEIPNLLLTSRSVAPRAINRKVSTSRLVSPAGVLQIHASERDSACARGSSTRAPPAVTSRGR